MEEKLKLKASREKEQTLGYSYKGKLDAPKRIKKIVLIDDDEVSNYINASLLEEMQVTNEVHTFLAAGEALHYFSEYHAEDDLPELILLDINMPGMDGFQFIEEYLKLVDEKHGARIVMFMTTPLSAEDEARAKKMGNVVAQFIDKPLTRGVIMTLIDRYFE
jgi:CheY-like chemotaxis protein